MKHLKVYEKKYNSNTLKQFISEKEEIYKKIYKFSVLEDLFEFQKKDEIVDIYFERSVAKVGDEMMIVTVSRFNEADSNIEQDSYLISNLVDLYAYMESPTLYKKVKKFNI